jgi:hypothetical protein
LLAGEPRILLDAIERDFGGAAEHRKHGAVLQEVDGIVAPFAVGDHAAVEIENAIEFEAVERDTVRRGIRSGRPRRCAKFAWIGVLRHRAHGAPPIVSGVA